MSDYINGWHFSSKNGDFILNNPHLTNYLYFPLTNQGGIMSSITPTLHGDIKSSHNNFLMAPVSAEALHDSRSNRNFWVYIDGEEAWSASGVSPQQIEDAFRKEHKEVVVLEAGMLWHRLLRENRERGLRAEVTSFAPANSDKVEIMKVTITNISEKTIEYTATAAVPIYCRSADNLRDHRHVTSLLNRVYTNSYGVVVKPTLTFDERGHKPNTAEYFVLGAEGDGTLPIGYFPDVDTYIGEGGSFEWPEAVVKNSSDCIASGSMVEGYEAVGAIRFKTARLNPGQSSAYIIVCGISDEGENCEDYARRYCNDEQFEKELDNNKLHWQEKTGLIAFASGEDAFDQWMKWVALQPILRRIYGCSFMPHHDYGRGGRGWRDLWQDCLALLIIDTSEVRGLLLNNFAGVRMDGSNATIIGSKPGEFIADRNKLPRVWMDHGAWPFLTTSLYINMSGDLGFLLEEQEYFRDKNIFRCGKVDRSWQEAEGSKQLDTEGSIYKGTILEHILVQNLTAFFNVGENNNISIEGADWNDGLDMAGDKGESVAFTAMYSYNLIEMAKLVLALKDKLGIEEAYIAPEIITLLDTLSEPIAYDSVPEKRGLLEEYYILCAHRIKKVKTAVKLSDLAGDLVRKGNWIIEHIRNNEWIKDSKDLGWFNGYYDNYGKRLEGEYEKGVRMTLTGQVFNIMGSVATDEQVAQIIEACNKYLKDEKIGGYRLNTNFEEVKLDMGRCFGFAFGHKENGAMFSHMAIMYANALYKRGYVKEGYTVINSIYKHCSSFEKSRIYPGIPEYINQRGRGMYHYLTGAASWLLLTMLCEVYGVRGELGDLVLEPKLMSEQFDSNGEASVFTYFADRKLRVIYKNASFKSFGDYGIKSIRLDNIEVKVQGNIQNAILPRSFILSLDESREHEVCVELQ